MLVNLDSASIESIRKASFVKQGLIPAQPYHEFINYLSKKQ